MADRKRVSDIDEIKFLDRDDLARRGYGELIDGRLVAGLMDGATSVTIGSGAASAINAASVPLGSTRSAADGGPRRDVSAEAVGGASFRDDDLLKSDGGGSRSSAEPQVTVHKASEPVAAPPAGPSVEPPPAEPPVVPPVQPPPVAPPVSPPVEPPPVVPPVAPPVEPPPVEPPVVPPVEPPPVVPPVVAPPANTAPSAGSPSLATSEDTPITVSSAQLLAGSADPDGDALSVSGVSVASGSATVTDNGDGTWTVIPAPDWFGTISLGFTVSDGRGGATAAAASIAVSPVNDAPVLGAATLSVAENSANGTVVGTVASTDIDGGTPVYSLVDSAGGRFGIDAATGAVRVLDGSLLDFEASASHTIRVRVEDGNGGGHERDYAVSVTDVAENLAPTITFADATVSENVTAIGTLSAADPDGDPIAWSIVGGADSASFSLTGATLSFVAPRDYEAPTDADADNVYEIEIKADDGRGGTSTRIISITVANVDEAPTASNGTLSVVSGGSSTFVPSATDPDTAPSDLVWSLSGAPAHGSVTHDPVFGWTYSANTGYEGADTFTLQVRDAAGNLSTATYTVDVDPLFSFSAATVVADVARGSQAWWSAGGHWGDAARPSIATLSDGTTAVLAVRGADSPDWSDQAAIAASTTAVISINGGPAISVKGTAAADGTGAIGFGDIAALKDGSGFAFVIGDTSWSTDSARDPVNGNNPGISLGFIDRDGTVRANGIQIAQDVSWPEIFPTVTALDGPNAGAVVVTWMEDGSIHARAFSSSGTPLFDQFRIPPTDNGVWPEVASDGQGGFYMAYVYNEVASDPAKEGGVYLSHVPSTFLDGTGVITTSLMSVLATDGEVGSVAGKPTLAVSDSAVMVAWDLGNGGGSRATVVGTDGTIRARGIAVPGTVVGATDEGFYVVGAGTVNGQPGIVSTIYNGHGMQVWSGGTVTPASGSTMTATGMPDGSFQIAWYVEGWQSDSGTGQTRTMNVAPNGPVNYGNETGGLVGGGSDGDLIGGGPVLGGGGLEDIGGVGGTVLGGGSDGGLGGGGFTLDGGGLEIIGGGGPVLGGSDGGLSGGESTGSGGGDAFDSALDEAIASGSL